MKKFIWILLLVGLPIYGFSQYSDDIEFVIEFTTARKFYYKENILVSEKNISMILNGLPDIRCFDSSGQELLSRNCAGSIREIIEEVSEGKCEKKPNGETLDHYLSNNTIIDMNGSHVTKQSIPQKQYYLFYSFITKEGTNVSREKINEMWSILNEALIKSRSSKICELYAVCILGLSLNGVTRLE